MTDRQLHKYYFYGLLITVLSVTFAGWFLGTSPHALTTSGERLIALGRLFGLLATIAILLEVFLMSRLPFMERTFDLHEYLDLHRLNGYGILLAISGHIVFLTLGYAAPLHTGLWRQFLEFNTGYEDVLKATIGTIVFFAATGLSVRLVRSRMRYEYWYVAHLLTYGAILLTFMHQLNTGSDFVGQRWFAAFWYALYIGVFGLLSYYRFVRQGVLWWQHDFTVDRVVKESDVVFSVYIGGKNVQDFAYEAGQYCNWRMLARGLWLESHPYSISSVPGTPYLRFSVRTDGGDFGKKLITVEPGTRVLVDGPRGAFTTERARHDRVVLVAGGIGIGPYMSTIATLLRQGKQVALLYAVHSKSHKAFGGELATLVQRGLILKSYVSDAGNRLRPTILDTLAAETTIYLCGPERLVRPFYDHLCSNGHQAEDIITEEFTY